MLIKKIAAAPTNTINAAACTKTPRARSSRRVTMALAALLALPLVVACENNDDPIDNLRDTAEEVGEDVEEAANDARRKVEDYQD
ncbi:MAG: hypothetical protein KJP25_09160 [Gammaproteobacteria bacterium]|nr:hypothetical protein [Gammaproteobacteria bacterium]MBT8150068.1 hypothetical protein [Gammaproteobacteria bacterium]NND39901.1 hypothetical protein [Pseudomonadales bacterium]NNM12441.1 hypothetical protein [Pseudomonadales bacterium]